MADELHLRSLFDAQAFAEEQARLGQIWTLVGYAADLPRGNDWFRAILGGRSVFMQRFADGLRGFENRCAHRSDPLRTAPSGQGPILLRVLREDQEGCENFQKTAQQIAGDPIYGASEIRVAWLNAAYAGAMRAAGPPQ
jgi:hypothetical protein